MSTLLIKNCSIVFPDRVAVGEDVFVSDGKISAIIRRTSEAKNVADGVVDGQGGYLAPGYIDLHTHGLGGFSFDSGVEQFSAICTMLPRYGVTGVLPTLIPKPKGADAEYVAAITNAEYNGAEVIGLHFEGPFIALPGAVPPEYLSKADLGRVKALKDAAGPYRSIFSISPEVAGILDVIPVMASDGAPVFMTHTRATVEQTQAAIDAGITHATHFYNVFPCPPEQEAGVRPCGAVEAVLANEHVSVDFILDGEHVDPIAVKMAMKCKSIDGVALVTDSNVGAGVPPGTVFDFGSYKIAHLYMGGPARICSQGHLCGALAGSGLTLDQAVRNAVRFLGIDVVTAARLASTAPARIAGYSKTKGRIQEGYDADFVLLDEQLNVRQTWVHGKSVFTV